MTYKDALFIGLDSEHPSQSQAVWLAQTLQKHPTVKWRFAFFHHPVYPCNGKSPFDEGVAWVRLFEKHKIDIVFVSHSHTYERTCPMVGGKCQAGGVVYLNSSGAGASARDVNATRSGSAGGDSFSCSAVLQQAIGNWNHYTHVAVDGDKLTLRVYSHDMTSAPKDTFTLSKAAP